MKKMFAWGFCNQLAPVINIIKAEKVCDVVVWVGNTPEVTFNIRRFFFGNFPRLDYQGCPTVLYDQVYQSLFTYIDMANRHNIFNDRTFHDYVNLFNRLVDQFYMLITQNKVEIILFSSLPHEGPDWILYQLGVAMGCKVILCYQSLFPDRFFFTYDHRDFGRFDGISAVSEYQSFEIPKKHEKDIFYMKNQKVYQYPLTQAVLRDIPKKRYTAFWVYRNVKRYNRRIKAFSSQSFDLGQPYVYFPLHLQPEMTTSTLGDQYNDQLLALERLSKKLPPDWFIYIKENPIQTEIMRGDWFFERLKSLPSVRMVPTQTSTYLLIKHAKFVATITGTVGWEAISGGKNVSAFGRPWYLQLPGVFKYDDNFCLEKLLNYKIDHKTLENELSKLMTKTGEGVMDEAYIAITEKFDPVSNGHKIADFLCKIIDSN